MDLRGSVQHHGLGVGVSSVLEENLVVGPCCLFLFATSEVRILLTSYSKFLRAMTVVGRMTRRKVCHMEDNVQHDSWMLSSEANETGNKQYDQLCSLRDGYAFWGITALPNASCRKSAE